MLEKLNSIYDKLKDIKYGWFDKEDIKIYEYSKPKEDISCVGFFMHCFTGKRIR